MSGLEEAFAKVVGRRLEEPERERLFRLRDALGLHDNDAFWAIVMALEHYDSFFRRYPKELARETERAMERARAAFAAAAEKEAAQVQRVLSEQVAKTSVDIARRLAEKPASPHQVTARLASVVAFGAMCAGAGYGWAGPGRPFWMTRTAEIAGWERVLSTILGVPAGWMVFALLVPAAGNGAATGWNLLSDVMAPRGQRTIGAALTTICVAGGIACVVLLLKMIG